MNLTTIERDTYREMFAVDEYRINSPGVRYLPAFVQWAQPGSSVLDAGAGPGAGSQALHEAGFRVSMCDLDRFNDLPFPFAQACLWNEAEMRQVREQLGPIDYVYCCDVLEHLPPAFTMLAVRNLLSIVTRGAFLSIAFVMDGHGAWVGKHLHQTVQTFTEWRDQLNEVGRVVDARDLALAGLFMVEPR